MASFDVIMLSIIIMRRDLTFSLAFTIVNRAVGGLRRGASSGWREAVFGMGAPDNTEQGAMDQTKLGESKH